jgi:hypothetical protein
MLAGCPQCGLPLLLVAVLGSYVAQLLLVDQLIGTDRH